MNSSSAMATNEVKVKEEITISVLNANLYSIIFLIPILLVFVVPYFMLWGGISINDFRSAIDGDVSSDLLFKLLRIGKYLGLFYVVMFVGIVAHELIHGLTWVLFCKNGWQSIKFGVMWKMLTPYAHCKEPLKANPYRLGAATPGIILGIIPSCIGLITGNGFIFTFGVFFTFAAGGDFIMLWLTRHLNNSDLVQDHADKIGCLVLEG